MARLKKKLLSIETSPKKYFCKIIYNWKIVFIFTLAQVSL